MSQSNFSAFSALNTALDVFKKEFKFFATILIIYILVSVLPYLYLFDNVDLFDPAAVMEAGFTDNLFVTALGIIFYLLYAYMFVLVLDKTNSSLNNISFNDYPYLSRGIQTVIPVILIYVITAILVGIGLVLLIIPGLIAMAGLYLAVPAKLAENISFYSSIPRSWQLTKGCRLSIWGMLLVFLVLGLIISFVLMGVLLTQIGDGDGLKAVISPFYLTINSVINGLFTIFYMIATGVAYHQIADDNVTHISADT